MRKHALVLLILIPLFIGAAIGILTAEDRYYVNDEPTTKTVYNQEYGKRNSYASYEEGFFNYKAAIGGLILSFAILLSIKTLKSAKV